MSRLNRTCLLATVAVLALLEEPGVAVVVVVVAGRTHPRVAATAVVTTDVVDLPTATVLAATGMITETAALDATITRTDDTDLLNRRDVDLLWMTTLPRVDGTTIRTDVIMALLRSHILTVGPMIVLRETSLPETADMVPVKVAILAMTIDEVVAVVVVVQVEVTGN